MLSCGNHFIPTYLSIYHTYISSCILLLLCKYFRIVQQDGFEILLENGLNEVNLEMDVLDLALVNDVLFWEFERIPAGIDC